MKKLISLVLCFVFVFSFAACGNKEDKKTDKVDLEYYAKLGQIPEVSYKLGDDCDKVNKELSDIYEEYLSNDPHNTPDHDHDHYAEDTYYEVTEHDDCVFINSGNRYFYYKNDEKKDGISYIVTFGDAFGFNMGDFIYEIQNALPNVDFVEEEIAEGELFFDEYISDATSLTAEYNGVSIMFVFLEGELYATAIYKTNSWK